MRSRCPSLLPLLVRTPASRAERPSEKDARLLVVTRWPVPGSRSGLGKQRSSSSFPRETDALMRGWFGTDRSPLTFHDLLHACASRLLALRPSLHISDKFRSDLVATVVGPITRRRRSFSSTAITGSGAGACSPLGARRTSGILASCAVRRVFLPQVIIYFLERNS